MRALVVAADCLGWPVIQLGIARWILGRPIRMYAQDSWLTQRRFWERDADFYSRWFWVDRWKRCLPEGAVMIGGSSNKRLSINGRATLNTFVAETRRAEQAHWYMLFCTPVFLVWNPVWAFALMAAYGVFGNVPCILSQRFNRLRAQRLSDASAPGHARA